MNELLTLAYDTDTQLAKLYEARQDLYRQVGYTTSSLFSMANARYYYRGRKRVTDMTPEEALEKVATGLKQLSEWRESNTTTDDSGWASTNWIGYAGILQPYDKDQAEKALERYAELEKLLEENDAASEQLEQVWREHRWSRFFLVTSSPGHIHSSMYCSTCRFTTTYGWLPELSGHSEEEAVEKHGPALCTVCFPSAPLDWTSAKLSKGDATKAAWDGTEKPQEQAAAPKPEATVCEGSGRSVYDGGDYGDPDKYAANRVYRYATCPDCRQGVSVTSTGKLRKHKPTKGS